MTCSRVVTGASLTFLIGVTDNAYPDKLLHPSNAHSHIKRVFWLVLRISIDLLVATLWLMAFVLSCFPKKPDFRNFLTQPPYKTWGVSLVTAFIQGLVSPSPVRSAP